MVQQDIWCIDADGSAIRLQDFQWLDGWFGVAGEDGDRRLG